MSTAIAFREPAPIEVAHELTVEQVIARIEKVHDVMRRAMQENHHYGVIPGTPKPTLLKPGAELLCVMFRLDPQYSAIPERHEEHLTYTTTCTLWHIPTGQRMGSGMGSCSTRESRYAFRQESRACPKCGSTAIIKGKAEYGGGWVCFKKKGGCGEKYADKDPAILEQPTGRVANVDLADQENTVLKMSNKRALVAAVLNVTAASDIFTQDLEDMPRETPVVVASVTYPADAEDVRQAAQMAPIHDAVEAPAVPAQPTFDEAMQAERGRLISEILDRKREIKLSDADFQDYKSKRLGKGTYQSCDLAALRDLRGDVFNAR